MLQFLPATLTRGFHEGARRSGGQPEQVPPPGGALGSASSFAPEVVPGLGLVRSGHGGAEVGKMALRGWAQRGWGCGQAWAPPVGGGCPELSAAQAPQLLGRR